MYPIHLHDYLSSLWISALFLGVLGSLHCAGMCGGLIQALNFSIASTKKSKTENSPYPVLLYNVGRILCYTLLGALTGGLGKQLAPWFNQSSELLRIMIGLVIISAAFYAMGWRFLSFIEKLGLPLWQLLTPLRNFLYPLNSPWKIVAAGMLWGFLPCHLVYSALALSLASASFSYGAFILFCFGLGTLPVLLLYGKATLMLTRHIKTIRLLCGITMLISGLWIIFSKYLMHWNVHHNPLHLM